MAEWLASGLITYRHRDDIRHFASTIWKKLFGTRTYLAFTGMQGAGKTVLFDHLSGKAFEEGYQSPRQSQKMEAGKIVAAGQKLKIYVVPGQDAQPRRLALETVFDGRGWVEGVVHVVSNGFATIRSPGAVQVLIRDLAITTIKKYREHQFLEELEDLDKTCERIRQAHRNHKGPKWLIVAVDKVDLYQDSVEKARHYYSEEGDSEFSERLRKLVHQVGSDNFRWTAVPVCALAEDFTWNNRTQATQISIEARNAYLKQFLDQLRDYCNK